MILYNGQRRTTGADFVSLGLVGGRLEFRSVSLFHHPASGEAELPPNTPLSSVFTDVGLMWAPAWPPFGIPTPSSWESFTLLSCTATTRWATSFWMVGSPSTAALRYCRHSKLSWLHVRVSFSRLQQLFLLGFIQGKFQGLDLNEELYVGGYPNYTLLAKTAGIKTGFVGKTSFGL